MSHYTERCACGHSRARHRGDQHWGACNVTTAGYGPDCACSRFRPATRSEREADGNTEGMLFIDKDTLGRGGIR